jgi:hypothetical protein
MSQVLSLGIDVLSIMLPARIRAILAVPALLNLLAQTHSDGSARSIGEDDSSSPIRVVHQLPGRMRVHFDSLKRQEHLEAVIEQQIRQLHGVRRVRASAVSGRVLIEYDSFTVAPACLVQQIADWWNPREEIEATG